MISRDTINACASAVRTSNNGTVTQTTSVNSVPTPSLTSSPTATGPQQRATTSSAYQTYPQLGYVNHTGSHIPAANLGSLASAAIYQDDTPPTHCGVERDSIITCSSLATTDSQSSISSLSSNSTIGPPKYTRNLSQSGGAFVGYETAQTIHPGSRESSTSPHQLSRFPGASHHLQFDDYRREARVQEISTGPHPLDAATCQGLSPQCDLEPPIFDNFVLRPVCNENGGVTDAGPPLPPHVPMSQSTSASQQRFGRHHLSSRGAHSRPAPQLPHTATIPLVERPSSLSSGTGSAGPGTSSAMFSANMPTSGSSGSTSGFMTSSSRCGGDAGGLRTPGHHPPPPHPLHSQTHLGLQSPPSSVSTGMPSTMGKTVGQSLQRPGGSPVHHGWDYEFEPPLDNKYECPICLHALRDPVQTMCGHRFCENCILKWLKTPPEVHCPVCNDVIFESQLFPDKFANREILGFKIRCPRLPLGCQHLLPLKDLQEHLSKHCAYEQVECPNRCRKPLMRKDVAAHCETECLYRMVECEHCQERVPVQEQMIHYKNCPETTTICEFCKVQIVRKNMEAHQLKQCENAPATCSFYYVGCLTKLSRRALLQHNKESVSDHMDLMVTCLTQLMEQSGQSRVSPSRDDSPSPAVGRTSQSSQGHFPRHQGPNENSYQSKLSNASMHPKKGFPRGSYGKAAGGAEPGSWEELQTEDQSMGLALTTTAQTYADEELLKPSLYVLDERRRQQDGQLVRHDQQLLALNAKLESLERKLQEQAGTLSERDDRISALEARLCSGVFFWRIKEFSSQRQEARQGLVTVLHSPGFYTSNHGYKLCIRANLNGVDSGNGSHISLFIHFMRGEFDDVLDWPFKGRITLSILDQGEPKQHIVEVLESKATLAAFQRPHSNRNHKGFGYIEFAPIALIENSSYVKNDTLIVKAEVKEEHS